MDATCLAGAPCQSHSAIVKTVHPNRTDTEKNGIGCVPKLEILEIAKCAQNNQNSLQVVIFGTLPIFVRFREIVSYSTWKTGRVFLK